jgi:3-oxoacyl-[acyl-carrier protein] reductase
MNLSLEGKNALVCGSSQGIGAAIAEELALIGANCILLARSEEALKNAVGSLNTSLGQTHSYYAIDFADSAATKALIDALVADQTIHILINNSGGPAAGPIVEATAEQFLAAFQQHLLICHLLSTAVLKGMKRENYGRIVNIISTSVRVPLKNLGVSNTTRGAVASWAKTLSNEVGAFGITVNNILPGYTKTKRLDSLLQHTARSTGVVQDEVAAKIIEDIPAKRFGEAAEIAAVAAFLTTPAAAYVNGVSIPVDGGRTGTI